jgi:hypothetical protein
MTEQEWLECMDPTLLLDYLQGKASDRKLLLFASACCWRVQSFMRADSLKIAVFTSRNAEDAKRKARHLEQERSSDRSIRPDGSS